MGTIRYTREDLELFSKASHDKSRLHMSEQYACQTIYGEPIVFGILGAFASLCALSDRHGQQIATTALDYRLPLYMGVDYQIETNESAQGRARVVLKDDRRIMMTSLFTFRGTRPPDGESDVPAIAPIHEQADWKPEELREDVQVNDRYAPSPEHLRALIQRWRLTEKGLTMPQVGVLLWSSYLTGMQLPGLRGTSVQLRLRFRPEGPGAETPFDYEARVAEFDERFSLLRTAAKLSGVKGVFADSEVSSHLRAHTPLPSAR